MVQGFLPQLWWLVVAHFAMDFPLQGDTVAVQKNRHTDNDLAKAVPWYYWMVAHALMQGAPVALITGEIGLGLCEAVAHFGIDVLKCDRRISIHADQGIHLAFKVVWAFACVPWIPRVLPVWQEWSLVVVGSFFLAIVIMLGFAPLIFPPRPKKDSDG